MFIGLPLYTFLIGDDSPPASPARDVRSINTALDGYTSLVDIFSLGYRRLVWMSLLYMTSGYLGRASQMVDDGQSYRTIFHFQMPRARQGR